jgi:YqjK-like protein
MSDRIRQLKERRELLELKSAMQRRQLGLAVESIDARIRPVEQVFGRARTLVQRPAVIAGGAVLALLIGPRRLLRIAGHGVLAVAAARRLLRFVRL